MSLQQTAAARRTSMGAGMEQVSSWSRDIRFASGIVLLVFATTHFLNHAAGIAGVEAMEQAQEWRYWLWHSWVGTVVLYGALIVHPFFALLRVAQRRTFKMPAREMLQIALGLAIPLFLIDHIVGTRVMGSFFHLDESYRAVLRRIWPGLAATQSLLLLLVWVHGIIGLHFTLRSRDGYQRWRDPFLLVAILIPVLALIGFAVGGREAGRMPIAPEFTTDAQIAMFNQNVTWAKSVFYGLVGCFVGFVAIREVRVRTTKQITVRFVGHGVRKLTPGLTVLEMFRRFGIPHAALCGGRARCATCRVLVLDGADKLPAPGMNEAKLLRRISAPERVRLACQIRPRDDVQVQILLASRLKAAAPGELEPDASVGKRGLTVVVADLRAFSALSERQLPQELIGLLNRFFDEMAQAITAHGGRIDAFYGDGFMAVFGLEGSTAKGAQTAIAAAGDIVRAVEALNREFGAALPLPLRIGIGIHSGQAITGAVENDSLGRREITVGETVAVAAQLELATRRVLADILVSEETIRISGRSYRGTTALKITIRGREKPLNALGFASAPEIADAEEENDAAAAPAILDAGLELAASQADVVESGDVAVATRPAAARDEATARDDPAEAPPAKPRRSPRKKAAAKKPDAPDQDGS
jgi:adenylate cyclase